MNYAGFPLGELIEELNDYGEGHTMLIEVASRVKQLKIEAERASQILRNLANGDLAGYAAEIARHVAIALDRAAA